MGRPRRSFYVLAAGGATVLTLALCELAVRAFDLGPEIVPIYAENFRLASDPVLGYELVPGSEYLGGTISSRGLRDREYAIRKPAGTLRIACVGDSICFGYDVRPEETLASRLADLLNDHYAESGVAFEVLNFGVMGYNVTQVVRAVETRVLAYEPDLVVYAYAVNDPQEYSTELDGLFAQLSGAQRDYLDELLRPGRRLASRSRLFLLARYALQSQTAAGGAPGATGESAEPREDPQWSSLWDGTYGDYYSRLHASPDGWGRVASGFRALGEIARREEIPIWVAIFPVLKDLGAYPLRDVHAKVAAAASAESLGVIDLYPAFVAIAQVRGARFARDFLHPDAPGYGFSALAVLRGLLLGGALPVDERDVDRLADDPSPTGEWARILLGK